MLWEISSCGIILLRVVSAGVSVSLLKFEKPVLSVNSEFLLIRPPGIRPKRDRWTGEDNGMEKVAGTAGEVTPGATNGASWMQTEGAQLVGL